MNRRKRMLEGLDEEIRQHIERDTQDNIARGMSPEEARRAALVKFGNVQLTKEDSRAVWKFSWLEPLRADVAGSVRRFRRHPQSLFVLILTLSVAIGGVIGVFDLAYQVLHGALPYRQPQRIVVAGGKTGGFLVSPYNWQPNPSAGTVFEQVAEYHLETADLDSASGPRRVLIACVTPKFFTVLGVRMTLGTDLPDKLASPHDTAMPWLPIVMSHSMWRVDFNSDKGIIGREITLKLLYPYHFLVVGVAPAGVRFPPGVDGWIPEHLTSFSVLQTAAPPDWQDSTIGRLRPGVSVSQAEAAIRSWPRGNFMWPSGDPVRLIPLREFLAGSLYRLAPLLWLVTVLFLALTIAVGVGIFRLDFEERRGEFGIKKVLGATPARLFRSLSVETLAILSLALAGGFLVSYAVLRVTVRYLHVPFAVSPKAGWTDLALALATVGLAAFVVGLTQARALGTFPIIMRPRAGHAHGDYAPRPVFKFRFPLQIVAATMILVTAALLFRSAYAISHMDTGVQPRGVFVGEVTLPLDEAEYAIRGVEPSLPRRERALLFQARLRQFHVLTNSYFSLILQRLKAHGGVARAGVISIAPYAGYQPLTLSVSVSRTPEAFPRGRVLSPLLVSLSPEALPALGTRLLNGRNFGGPNADEADQGTVLENEAMARSISSGAQSLGWYVSSPGSSAPDRIVGIVQNVHEQDLFAPPVPTVYYPFSEDALPDVDVVFRTSPPMKFQQARSLLQSAVHSIAPGSVIPRFESLDEMVMSAGTLTRYSAYFLLALATLGVFMVGIGAWAQSVAEVRRRKHEIGIRLALGAEPRQVARAIIGKQIGPSFFAACTGGVLAWWFSRLVGFLFRGVNLSGPGSYLLSVAAIEAYVLFVSLGALWGTIRRNPRDLISARTL